MIRKAEPKDAHAIAAFLEGHIDTSMFLLGNLVAHGIGTSDHPHATTYLLRENGEGITGVFGCTVAGMLMCQLPGLTVPEAESYAYMLQGYTLLGMTGVADQAQMILSALNLPDDVWQLNRAEPQYSIALSDLPTDAGEMRDVGEQDVALLTDWLAQYLVETNTAPPAGAAETAAKQAAGFVGSPNLRLLVENGAPVGMAGINARAGHAVQLGRVFVPPALRGARRAGKAINGLLQAEAGRGVKKATLFAASADAARSYERIGFDRIGDYQIALLRDPITLGSPQ